MAGGGVLLDGFSDTVLFIMSTLDQWLGFDAIINSSDRLSRQSLCKRRKSPASRDTISQIRISHYR
jgi:hypothetical protein